MKWVNEILRIDQSNTPWVGWISEEKKQEYFDAGWKEVPDDYVLPRLLEEEKANKKTEINQAKNDAESATPFTYLDKPFDYDALSRERLNVAIQLAQSLKIAGVAGTQKVTDWKLADNTLLELTVDMLCNMPQAFAVKSAELHIKAWTLKAQVDEATTLEQTDAITW
jgi:hypothetical protein